jgi:hypothetical protein
MITDYPFVLGKYYPRCNWHMNGDLYENLFWDDENIGKPSKEELDSRYKNYRVNFAYLDRRKEQLSNTLCEQIQMLWEAMDIGEIPKAQNFYDHIAEVRREHPSPEERLNDEI